MSEQAYKIINENIEKCAEALTAFVKQIQEIKKEQGDEIAGKFCNFFFWWDWSDEAREKDSNKGDYYGLLTAMSPVKMATLVDRTFEELPEQLQEQVLEKLLAKRAQRTLQKVFHVLQEDAKDNAGQ
jgi:hypothetical protein